MLEAKILRCFKGRDRSALSKNDNEALIKAVKTEIFLRCFAPKTIGAAKVIKQKGLCL